MRYSTRAFWLGCVMASTLALPGCKQFTVETVVTPDGGGTRVVTLDAGPTENDELNLTLDQYRTLLGVTEQKGWRLSWEERAPGEERRAVFTRRVDVPRLAGWAEVSGDISPRGALEGSTLGDVHFSNEVRVTIGRGSQGTTYTYEETMDWYGLRETLVDYVATRFREEAAREFPALSPLVLAELKGLAAGLTAMDLARLFEASDDEWASLPMVKDAGIYGARILSRAGVTTTAAQLEGLAARVLDDEDDRLERFLRKELPGVEAMALTNIELSVTLPGTITESNADKIDGNIATWDAGILDALGEPMIMRASSELAK